MTKVTFFLLSILGGVLLASLPLNEKAFNVWSEVEKETVSITLQTTSTLTLSRTIRQMETETEHRTMTITRTATYYSTLIFTSSNDYTMTRISSDVLTTTTTSPITKKVTSTFTETEKFLILAFTTTIELPAISVILTEQETETSFYTARETKKVTDTTTSFRTVMQTRRVTDWAIKVSTKTIVSIVTVEEQSLTGRIKTITQSVFVPRTAVKTQTITNRVPYAKNMY